jgi:hypothetical protein
MKIKRTGLRKPKHYLTAWGDSGERITARLQVNVVDEWLSEVERGKLWDRKSWFIALTQQPDLLKKYGPVKGLPKKGTTLVLFEDDVVALVKYLIDAGWVEFDDKGRAVNGPACEDAAIAESIRAAR